MQHMKKKIPLQKQVMLQHCMPCREESVRKQNIPTVGKKKNNLLNLILLALKFAIAGFDLQK